MTTPVVKAVEFCNVALGLSLNALLLFLIAKYSNHRLGNYRNVLKMIACYDIFIALLHAVFQPASYSSGSALGVYSRTFPEQKYASALCSSCMTAAFTFMNISFLHRFWSVRRTHRVALFSKPLFLLTCSLYPLTMAVLWYCAAISLADNAVGEEILERTISDVDGVTVADGWLIIHFWENGVLHVRGLIILTCGSSIIVTNLVIGAFLFCLTIHHLKTDNTFSTNNRQYQFKILQALVAQSAMPLLFVYVPAGVGITLPLFVTNERKGELDPWFTLISGFPALDAAVIMLLMRDYRYGLRLMIIGKNRVEMNRKTIPST